MVVNESQHVAGGVLAHDPVAAEAAHDKRPRPSATVHQPVREGELLGLRAVDHERAALRRVAERPAGRLRDTAAPTSALVPPRPEGAHCADARAVRCSGVAAHRAPGGAQPAHHQIPRRARRTRACAAPDGRRATLFSATCPPPSARAISSSERYSTHGAAVEGHPRGAGKDVRIHSPCTLRHETADARIVGSSHAGAGLCFRWLGRQLPPRGRGRATAQGRAAFQRGGAPRAAGKGDPGMAAISDVVSAVVEQTRRRGRSPRRALERIAPETEGKTQAAPRKSKGWRKRVRRAKARQRSAQG